MRFKRSRSDEGTVLIVALILLVVLAFAASTSVMNSTTNIKVGSNYANTVGIFNLAEQGIAKGKLILKNTANFDELLNPASYPDGILIPTTDEGEGTYSVKITNNHLTLLNPDTGGATNDTDNIVILISTAIGKTGAKVEIETYVGRPTSIQFPPSPASGGGGAAGLCGEGPNVSLTGSSKVSGYDWDVPADFNCGGSGCAGTQLADQTNGTCAIVLDNPANASDRIARSDENRMEAPAPNDKWRVDSGLDCDGWLNLSNQLAALGSGPNVQYITTDSFSGNGTWGTRDDPMITIINTPSDNFTLSGTVDGAGVIVVASNTSITLTGTFHYEGVLIVLGDNAQVATGGGAVDFFGYVIVNSSIVDLPPELANTGDANFKWSTAAYGTAMDAISGATGGGGGSQLVTYSWSERY